MASFGFLLGCTFLLLLISCVSANVVEHTFKVENLTVNRLCREQVIVAVNGRYPGPTIHVHEGDTLIVHVLNKSPHKISIHWHGVHQLLSGWADGAAYVTQCPILPNDSYTYKFNITKQEGTLWWHAHFSWLRATVHGALIIHPKAGGPYPFEKPYKEIPILLGDWWNADMVQIENQFIYEDMNVMFPDALTINGQPGDFYQCSSKDGYKLRVKHGETYLLRIINVGLTPPTFFFKIANHKMTVVSVDACYIKPYVTDVVVVSPGQTIDVIFKADQRPTSYYMQAHAYIIYLNPMGHAINVTTSGILIYEGTSYPPSVLPVSPTGLDLYDTLTIYNFSTSLTGLTTGPFWVPVPQVVDEHMFITVGLGVIPCNTFRNDTSGCRDGQLVYCSMNNVSFQLPIKMSMLEAFTKNIEGIFTTDFPTEPPVKFDYTNPDNQFNDDLTWIGEFGTKVKKLRYNTTIQIVLQSTTLQNPENHPIHLHGFNFHVLAQGFGNYDSTRDERYFNLINPPQRNTVVVPAKGWVVIRFQANNPGVWLMHCHLGQHLAIGLATAFVVENGPSDSTSLPRPPLDLSKCNDDGIVDSSEISTMLASVV